MEERIESTQARMKKERVHRPPHSLRTSWFRYPILVPDRNLTNLMFKNEIVKTVRQDKSISKVR